MGNLKAIVGHLAYPNPQLNNAIPERVFYGFERVKNHSHGLNEILYEGVGNYKATGRLIQSVDRKEYVKKIVTIKKLLRAGEIYQLNYAIRFQKKFEGDPYALFLKWIQASPSRFSAFINGGDYQIISNSPEQLFQVKDSKITSEPIKGTVKKTNTLKKNENLKAVEILLGSEKEAAELNMITDLARNDVGQVCEFGTLTLEKYRALLELPNLWHTYSKVSGKLPKKTRLKDVVNAMFPGGSITGCPKKRAMMCIEALEKCPRNIFTGSIGYIKSGKTIGLEANFNIAIRTALVKDGIIEYWAGGGIVIDSDPEAEYEECLLKAESFLNLL